MASGYQLTPEELAAVAENGSQRDQAAVANGQVVATGNQSLTNQGVRAGATQVASAPAAAAAVSNSPTTAPPNAAAATKKDNVFTGLCESIEYFSKRTRKEIARLCG